MWGQRATTLPGWWPFNLVLFVGVSGCDQIGSLWFANSQNLVFLSWEFLHCSTLSRPLDYFL